MKKVFENSKKIMTLLISFITILAIIGSLFLTIYDYILENKSIKITAIVREINYNNISSNATIEYEVNKEKFENTISTLGNNTLSVNDKVTVKVDLYNPAKIINNEHLFITAPIIVISLVLCLIYMPSSIKYIKSDLNKKNIKQNGIYIIATISEVFINNNGKKYKDKFPYRLRCKYQNPADNQLYVFDSEDNYTNIEELIHKYNKTTVIVYLEKGHPENYFVDLDSLLPQYNLIDPVEFMKTSSKPKEEKEQETDNNETADTNDTNKEDTEKDVK